MVQQTAIYNQGCESMVSGLPPIHFLKNGIIFLDRAQVRMFSALDGRCLT